MYLCLPLSSCGIDIINWAMILDGNPYVAFSRDSSISSIKASGCSCCSGIDQGREDGEDKHN